jgi:hypothetical protein
MRPYLTVVAFASSLIMVWATIISIQTAGAGIIWTTAW